MKIKIFSTIEVCSWMLGALCLTAFAKIGFSEESERVKAVQKFDFPVKFQHSSNALHDSNELYACIGHGTAKHYGLFISTLRIADYPVRICRF